MLHAMLMSSLQSLVCGRDIHSSDFGSAFLVWGVMFDSFYNNLESLILFTHLKQNNPKTTLLSLLKCLEFHGFVT